MTSRSLLSHHRHNSYRSTQQKQSIMSNYISTHSTQVRNIACSNRNSCHPVLFFYVLFFVWCLVGLLVLKGVVEWAFEWALEAWNRSLGGEEMGKVVDSRKEELMGLGLRLEALKYEQWKDR